MTTYKPKTGKRARVIAHGGLFAGGSVRLPKQASWLEDFIAELLAFPGRYDDQVDALTRGLAWARQDWRNAITYRRAIGMILAIDLARFLRETDCLGPCPLCLDKQNFSN